MRVLIAQRVPGEEDRDAEQDPAGDRHQLAPVERLHVHWPGSLAARTRRGGRFVRPVELRQLIPEDASVEVLDLLGGLEPESRAAEDRPYTIVNFITSADGRAAFHGRSAPLGDQVDREVFHGLREQVDAVLAGIGTLRTERYGRLVRDPERRRRRVEAGRRPEPGAWVVPRRGDVPGAIPLV